MRGRDLYEDDFYAWTRVQAKELRRFARMRPNLPLDLGHIAVEIGDLGREQRNALRSWTTRLIEHLLLLEHSGAGDSRAGWIDEIGTFRRDIELRLTPTLRRELTRQLPRLYDLALRHIGKKFEIHGEPAALSKLPETCPYTLDQILGPWWPDDDR